MRWSQNESEAQRHPRDLSIKCIQTKHALEPERQWTSDGVVQVVLTAGNKWRGSNLHDARWS